jgi:hypothetical protein
MTEESTPIRGHVRTNTTVEGAIHGTPVRVELVRERDYTITLAVVSVMLLACVVVLGEIRDELSLANCIADGHTAKACKSVE